MRRRVSSTSTARAGCTLTSRRKTFWWSRGTDGSCRARSQTSASLDVSIDWSNWLLAWLIDWLIDWLSDRLIDWLADWLMDWRVGGLDFEQARRRLLLVLPEDTLTRQLLMEPKFAWEWLLQQCDLSCNNTTWVAIVWLELQECDLGCNSVASVAVQRLALQCCDLSVEIPDASTSPYIAVRFRSGRSKKSVPALAWCREASCCSRVAFSGFDFYVYARNLNKTVT